MLKNKIAKTARLLVALILASGWAHADDKIASLSDAIERGDIDGTHGNIGTGFKFAQGERNGVLVEARFHGLTSAGEPRTSWRLFWVEAAAQLSRNQNGENSIPNYSVTISPISKVKKTKIASENENFFQKLELLPTEFSRQIDLGYGDTITIRALKYSGTASIKSSDRDSPLLSMGFSLDALGYSMVKSYYTKKTSQEPYIIGGSLNAGIDFPLNQSVLPRGARLRLNLANLSLAVATNRGKFDVFAEAALMLRNKISEMTLFVRGGVDTTAFGPNDPSLTEEERKEQEDEGSLYLITGLNYGF